MNNDIQQLLEKMTFLLETHDPKRWGLLFRYFLTQYPLDPFRILSEIRSTYAGMGSFNDLCLQSEKGVLREENDELDRLRQTLFVAIFDERQRLAGLMWAQEQSEQSESDV